MVGPQAVFSAVAALLALTLLAAGFPIAAWAAAPPPPPLEAYGQLPTLEMVTLSPSGNRMALVVHDAHGTKVYARQIDGPILMAAPVNQGYVESVRWAGENIVLVRISNVVRDYYGFSGLAADEFMLDLAAHKETQLFANTAEIAPEIYGAFGIRNLQSGWYGYYGTTTCSYSGSTACIRSLYRVDLATGQPLMLDKSDVSPQWMISGAGDADARLVYDERSSRWTLISAAAHRTLSEGVAGFDGISLWGPGRNGQTAAFVTRADDGFYTLFEAPLGGGSAPVALTSGREVLGSWLDPVDGHLTGYQWADDTWHDVAFDPAVQARLDAARAAFPNYLVRLGAASRDFGRMVALTDGGDDSGTYWLVDIATRHASILGSAYPQVTSAATGPVSVFTYKAADGTPLEGVLTLPPGRVAKNLPLVVLAHDGPEARERPGFDWVAQAFASRGYAVLAPNFRGSSGFGKAFRDLGFDQWGRKMQTDISDGVDALAAAGVIDPKRACIVGLGYGGYAAVAGVTLQHGRYRCAVSYWGLFDVTGMYEHKTTEENLASTRYWASFLGVGKPDTNLEAISPMRHAADADAPILLVSTKPDWTMLIDQAPAMAQALRQAGKTVVLTRIDSEDWRMRSPDVRLGLLKAAVPFVQQYDPADPG